MSEGKKGPPGATPETTDWRDGYHALVESCALIARTDRGAVRVTGERAAEMLNGLLTNQVTGQEGAGCHAMLLTPKGRVLTDLRVLPSRGHLLLDVPRRGLENLLTTFKKYLPPIYSTFEDVSPGLTQLGVYGPKAETAVAGALGAALPEAHLGLRDVEVEGSSALVIRNRWLAGDGVEIIAAVEAARALAARLVAAVKDHGGLPAGPTALEVVRVESGIPEYGVDMNLENLAQETGLAEAISYDKGCYLGQEVVARIHFRGHVNRQLRSLQFDAERPPSGARLLEREKEVGTITSVVTSPEHGHIGLGYVRREVEPGSRLRWSSSEGEGGAEVRAVAFRARFGNGEA